LYLYSELQPSVYAPSGPVSCDLLSKNCIFTLNYNFALPVSKIAAVVICFQKIVSLLWITTKGYKCSLIGSCDLLSKNCIFTLNYNILLLMIMFPQLWFAFKKLYLYSELQLLQNLDPALPSCDLLSKNCIFTLNYNISVVIRIILLLWFAFKKLYLYSELQHHIHINAFWSSCDLLSKNCIFTLNYNQFYFLSVDRIVVICFQKIVSLLWITTKSNAIASQKKLWFAFKKLYLYSELQLDRFVYLQYRSCDLLSKNCIFTLNYNFRP